VALLLIQGSVGKTVDARVRDPQFLVDWLPQIVQDIGMVSVGKPIVEEYAHWDGSAPSAVQSTGPRITACFRTVLGHVRGFRRRRSHVL